MLWSCVSELPSIPPSFQSLTAGAGEVAHPAESIPGWERDRNTTLQMHKAGGTESVGRERGLCLQTRAEHAVKDSWRHLGYIKLCFSFSLCFLEGGGSPHISDGADHDTARLAWKSDGMDLTRFQGPQPLHLQGRKVTEFLSKGSRDLARREMLQKAPKGRQIGHMLVSPLSALPSGESGR